MRLSEVVNHELFQQGFEDTRTYGRYQLKATPGYMPYIPGQRSTTSQYFRIEALLGRAVIGWVNFEDIDGNLEALDLHVDPKHRRRGIASEMYKFARELGNTVKPSHKQTGMGRQFWSKDHSQ